MTAVLGIVAALEMERRWIRAPEPLIELSGIGDERAENAARSLLDRGATALVSWGVAGGLDPDLVPGTVVLPEFIVAADGSHLEVDATWRNRLLIRIENRMVTSTSPLLHAVQPITEPEEKHAMYRRTGAVAVDMESAAVAVVANEFEVPFVAVRAVVDAAAVSLPEAALAMYEEGGGLNRVALLRLVFQPGEWRGLFALGRANAAAGRSMREVWSAAGPDLALSEVQR